MQDVAKTMLAIIPGYVVQSAILGDAAPPDLAPGLQNLADRGADAA